MLQKLDAFRSAYAAMPSSFQNVGTSFVEMIQTGATEEMRSKLKNAADSLVTAGQTLGESGMELAAALMNSGLGTDGTTTQPALSGSASLKAIAAQITNTQKSLSKILANLNSSDSPQKLQTEISRLDGIIKQTDAIVKAIASDPAIQDTKLSQEDLGKIQTALNNITSGLSSMNQALQALQQATEILLSPSFHPEELEAARSELKKAGDAMEKAMHSLSSAIDHGIVSWSAWKMS